MALQDLSDEELVYQLQDLLHNDEHSSVQKQLYKILYDRYYGQAISLCRYYGLNYNDAEDTTQEVFVRCFKYLTKFKKDVKFKPWLFKIVLNEVRDKFSYLKKRKTTDIEDIQEVKSENDENIFESFHFNDHIQGILNKMPEKIRKILLLRIYSEMEVQEIAASTGMSARYAYILLNQGYSMLKKELEVEHEPG